MKILAINGSPSGTRGATWWVLEKFLTGATEAGAASEVIHLATKKIRPCTGELACWTRTPGKCIHGDDMADVIAAGEGVDALVLATPVYVDGMTGLLKNCIDRLVPTADPHFEIRDGHCRHPSRGPWAAMRRVALVSVCGFPEIDNFDPLVAHVKAICRNMHAEFAGAVLRPAAPMFPALPTIHPLFFKIRAVAKAIGRAGREFALGNRIADETRQAAAAEIVTREQYREQVNRWFDKELKKLQEQRKA